MGNIQMVRSHHYKKMIELSYHMKIDIAPHLAPVLLEGINCICQWVWSPAEESWQ